jgi:hypothetical protein
MWLLELTGDPHRKIRIEFDPDTGADIVRPASTFHFPACKTCNERYGEGLEARAQRIVIELSRRQSLAVGQCYVLLDWLDKVRVGLWLGYNALHKDIIEPHFRIDGRVAKKDRVAIISVDPNDGFKGFNVGGCDNNVFRTTQAGIYLRINNVRILSVSSDLLIARLAGLPHATELFLSDDYKAYAVLAPGDNQMSQDWKSFTTLGTTIIAQPMVSLDPAIPGRVKMYVNVDVMSHSKDSLRSLKPKPGTTVWPLQLISNADGGRLRYFPNKRTKVRFEMAEHNSDLAFMHALYAIFLQFIIEREPRKIMGADGKKRGSALGNYLYVQKLLQVLMRLEQMGIPCPDPALKDDLINELQRFSRIREEIEAHAHGTLEPGREKPMIL